MIKSNKTEIKLTKDIISRMIINYKNKVKAEIS